MCDDESLRSKYTRLGIEFKKLREKHRLTKESLRGTGEQVRLLETQLRDQSIHVRNLEQEKESLLFRNQYLVKQASFLQTQLDSKHFHNPLRTSNLSSSNNCDQQALQRALAECNRLHEELVSQSSNFLARIAVLEKERRIEQTTRPSQSVTTQTDLNPIGSSISSSLDMLSLHESSTEKEADPLLTGSISLASTSSPRESTSELSLSSPIPFNTLQCPSNTKSEKVHLSVSPEHMRCASLPGFKPPSLPLPQAASKNECGTKENLLLLRIGQLEHQLAEVSLRQHLELRRTELARRVSSSSTTLKRDANHLDPETRNTCFLDSSIASESDFLLSSPLDPCSPSYSPPPTSTKSRQLHDKLLSDFLESQLADCNQQLVVYAGRAAAAADEIRSMHELLAFACNERDSLRAASKASAEQITNLEDELESIKMRTAQQLSDMAAHLAALTDEIHFLRNGRLPHSSVTNGKHASTDSRLSRPSATLAPDVHGTTYGKVNSFFSSLLR